MPNQGDGLAHGRGKAAGAHLPPPTALSPATPEPAIPNLAVSLKVFTNVLYQSVNVSKWRRRCVARRDESERKALIPRMPPVEPARAPSRGAQSMHSTPAATQSS